MTLYNEQTTETTVAVTTYDRAYKISIANPLSGAKTIRYDEQTITTTNDGEETVIEEGPYKRSIEASITELNAGTSFPLLNPLDGTPLGSEATYADLQVLLYSLYYALAEERDNA